MINRITIIGEILNKDGSRFALETKVVEYSDGQQDVILKPNGNLREPNVKIDLHSRFNNFRDLELIICTTKALRKFGIEHINLHIPYLLGARSDRQFQEGGTSYLVDVVAPILNSLNFKKIITMDVHSDVAAACINNLVSESNFELVDWALGIHIECEIDELTLIAPDAGASKKINQIAKEIGYKNEIIYASKDRDIKTGKILKTNVPLKRFSSNYLIIDDLVDGGRTFIEIAKVIKQFHLDNEYKTPKIYLIVTHGIFSNGFKELSEQFDGIYCTNSYKDLGDTYFDGNKTIKHNVKQLKVII